MNISQLKNWRQRGEVATLFTVAALVLMAAGTLLGSARVVQDNVLKLGSFAYDNSYRAHFYKGPTFEEKDRIPGQPNSGYTLVRGSLCFTGTTIPSQLQQFWVHTPQDPNQGYPQKACDNTNKDANGKDITKDDCIVHEGRTVKYIAPQTSRPYCDSPDVGKANWRAWDFTLKLQAPYSKDLCSGLFVSSSSSFVSRDPIEIDMNAWHRYLGQHGVNCGPTPTVVPSENPTAVPSVVATNTPTPSIVIPTAKPTIDNRITAGPTVRISIRPTDKPRCPDPKRPCPSITPVGECRTDITCSSKSKPCPSGYSCLFLNEDLNADNPGTCVSNDRKCNPTTTPTPPRATISPQPSCNDCVSQGKAYRCTGDVAFPGQSPAVYCSNTDTGRPASCQLCTPVSVTSSPVQAKIRGDIIVNSCKKPDSVDTRICSKTNPSTCLRGNTPVTFVGQDPTNPNKWVYSYEHTVAPIDGTTSYEPIERGLLYAEMQAYAHYSVNGLITDYGIVTYPPFQANQKPNVGYTTIPASDSESIINYEVLQNSIVCPPVSPSVKPSEAPTAIPSPAICKYSAVVEVIDEATGLPVPISKMGDASKWGLANDKQDPKPRTLFTVSGDMVGGERVSKYKFQTDTLTFRPTDANALYTKGEKAYVNLFVDTKKWQITEKLPCRGSKGCPFPNEPITVGRNLDQYGSKVDGFAFDCGTQVTVYGWKVKQLPPTSPENPGQPGQPAGQCVLRDPVNAVKCSPKNVKAVRKSTSTVAVSWTAPDASCNFTAGSNGDFYRIDLIDMTENPRSVITTCDKITRTSAECTLSTTYNPNKAGTRGNFKAGHNYIASVYAFKEIPGSVDMCVSNNGNAPFDRPAKDNGSGDAPEPTTTPIGGRGGGNGGELLTRQLDWMVNNVGVCWAGWSHGDCRLNYNGTNEWRQSVTDGRFKCLAPYGATQAVPGQETVIIGLMDGQNTKIEGIQTKRVDCSGTLANACVAAKDSRISQCESDLSNATTANGQTITLNPKECWTLDVNLGIHPFSCAPVTNKKPSDQPAPRTPGQPQPTSQPGTGEQQAPEGAVKGKVTIRNVNDSVATAFDESDLRVYYQAQTDGIDSKSNSIAEKENVDMSNGTFDYTINDFDPSKDRYVYQVEVFYESNNVLKVKRKVTIVANNDFNEPGIWDTTVILDPSSDDDASDTNMVPFSTSGTIRINKDPEADITFTNDSNNRDILLTYDPRINQENPSYDVKLDGAGNNIRYTINDFINGRDTYTTTVDIIYSAQVNGKYTLHKGTATNSVAKGEVDEPAAWNFAITLDPTKDPIFTPGDDTSPGKKNILFTLKPTFSNITILPTSTTAIIRKDDGSEKDIAYSLKNDGRNVIVTVTLEKFDANAKYYTVALQIGYQNTDTKATGTVPLEYVITKEQFNNDPVKINVPVPPRFPSLTSLLSSISLQNNSSSPITSVSIASCDSANKCASNTVSVGLAAGASTKFKPTFSVPGTTRRLSCVVKFANGTSKQCTPQLVTGSNGLQFTITAQANNTVSTTVLSPLKTADTNRDCKVTSADAVGLRDLDGNGSVNAADTSLFFSYIGQNACN